MLLLQLRLPVLHRCELLRSALADRHEMPLPSAGDFSHLMIVFVPTPAPAHESRRLAGAFRTRYFIKRPGIAIQLGLLVGQGLPALHRDVAILRVAVSENYLPNVMVESAVNFR